MNMDYPLTVINSIRSIKRKLYAMNPELRKKAEEIFRDYIRALYEIRKGLPDGESLEELCQYPEFKRQVIFNMEAALYYLRAEITRDPVIREQVCSLKGSYPEINFKEMFGV